MKLKNLLKISSSLSVRIKNAGKIPIKLNTSELKRPTKRVDDILDSVDLHELLVDLFILISSWLLFELTKPINKESDNETYIKWDLLVKDFNSKRNIMFFF